jgi:hypothetical protein
MWGRLRSWSYVSTRVQLASVAASQFHFTSLRWRGDCRTRMWSAEPTCSRWGHRATLEHASGAQEEVLRSPVAAGETEGFNDTMKVAVRGRS